MSSIAVITPTFSTATWVGEMRKVWPSRDVRGWPELGALADFHYCAVWLPPPKILTTMPNLKVIFALGAGVDGILSDATLPAHVPIVRLNDLDLTTRMGEFVLMHVLLHHRQQKRIDASQREAKWDVLAQHAAQDMSVGIMGLGVLGQDCARKLLMMGFHVRGWSRTPKSIPGLSYFAGAKGLDAFLAGTDILVCLLPATSETAGLLNRDLFGKLSRRGPLGAPVLINAGRGRQQNEDDILACLEDGTLHGASLDVFRVEPLPPISALWRHPKVYVSPHSAADSEPSVVCRYMAAQIARFESGLALENVVDRERGY